MPPATPYCIEPLTKSHDRSGFRCGSEALDRYLAQQARQDAEKNVAAPFVLVEPPSPAVLGYYTLSASVLNVADIPPALLQRASDGDGELLGELGLTDDKGCPLCARVRPPTIRWSLVAVTG